MRRNIYKQSCAGLIACLVVVSLVGLPVKAEPLDTSAESAVLMDAASKTILYEKNAHEKREPASVTKIMTMLLALEAVEQGRLKLEEEVIISENAHREVDSDGSVVFLEMGERRTVEELLIGIAVGSGNDACVALAEHMSGSEANFVQLMNKRAKELGMNNTNFVNVHGMPDPNHYTSAYDIALMCFEAVRHPQLLEYTSIYEYKYRDDPPLVLWNTNKLLAWYKDVVDGLKTGWTEKAGYCLAATGKKDGFRLISVVLGCPVPRSHFQEAIKLLNYGFANYTSLTVADKGEIKATLPVLRGVKQEVSLLCARNLAVTIPKGEESAVSWELELSSNQLEAPVAAGTVLGRIVAKKDGQPVGITELVAAEDIGRLSFGGLFRRVITTWLVSNPQSSKL
ncbi:MAG: D-alanyl-D-alanine carboxypeptidase [Firmicutes bacterium]|jgi:D-alanyl-D-alanine carboxypeptidase (penicillin-binding protein 5/6)|nr:D-alanyl-D-alanine carboxypeptidase [Bacillota bacterium]